MTADSPPAEASAQRRKHLSIALLVVALLGLPLAVWFDVRNLTHELLRQQASEVNSMITSIRGYYSNNVVSRIQAHNGDQIKVLHNYEAVPGAIPIPATLSIELGAVIGKDASNVSYRFVSDYPFRNRGAHFLDHFETSSLSALRARPDIFPLISSSAEGLQSEVRLISPVVMGTNCVDCHNKHPESTKVDWKVGDIRGIQEITVSQPIALNLWSFKFSLMYFFFIASIGTAFISLQQRQNATIRDTNKELSDANQFLASISLKISHYLSPQIYKSIFSGEMDVSLKTSRKKLTVFFSDIKDFTALTEELQPEELTALINQYFTEMSSIALKHGGTIDKFIGDAILVFFGDPNTLGPAEDAKACVRMAIDMQRRLAELNVEWRKRGSEVPFRVRMGINTGYCSVGNFGSVDRMDYTILGAEVNLSARLQSIAEPGGIVTSYETYALVRDLVEAHALPAVTMKGIAREVVPYAIQGILSENGTTLQVISEQAKGLDLYMDMGRIDASMSDTIRSTLNRALAALDVKKRS